MSDDSEICVLEFNTPEGKVWRVIHRCGENQIATSDWADAKEFTDIGEAFREADRMQKEHETEYGIFLVCIDELLPEEEPRALLRRLDAYCKEREATELGEDAPCSVLAHELRMLLRIADSSELRKW